MWSKRLNLGSCMQRMCSISEQSLQSQPVIILKCGVKEEVCPSFSGGFFFFMLWVLAQLCYKIFAVMFLRNVSQHHICFKCTAWRFVYFVLALTECLSLYLTSQKIKKRHWILCQPDLSAVIFIYGVTLLNANSICLLALIIITDQQTETLKPKTTNKQNHWKSQIGIL